MPSENKIQIKSTRQVKHKIDFLYNKVAGVLPTPYVGSGATWDKILNYRLRFNTAWNAVEDIQTLINTNHGLMVPAIGVLHTWESSYYSTFISANKLNYFPSSDRVFIGLADGNDKFPPMSNYPEIMETGSLVIVGDAKRIAAGSAAMALPSITDFTAKYTPANLYYLTNSSLGEALSTAKQTLKALLEEGCTLCAISDKEIETFFYNKDKATMRNNSGFWGVHYASSTPISFLALTFLHGVTHAALEHVLLLATPGLEEGESNAQGFDSMNIHTFGAVTVNSILTGFIPDNTIFDTVEGQTITRTIFMHPVPPPPPVI